MTSDLDRRFDHQIWAQLTGFDGGRYYSWTEQQPSPNGQYLVPLLGGRFGSLTTDPVFIANGDALPIGTYAKIRFAYMDPVYNNVHLVEYPSFVGSGADSTGSNTTTGTFTVTPNMPNGAVVNLVATTATTGTYSSNVALGVPIGSTFTVNYGGATYTGTATTSTGGTFSISGGSLPVSTQLTLTVSPTGTTGTSVQITPTAKQQVAGKGSFVLSAASPLTNGGAGTYSSTREGVNEQAYTLAASTVLRVTTSPGIPDDGSVQIVLTTPGAAIVGVLEMTATSHDNGTWALYASANLTNGLTGMADYAWDPSDFGVTGSFSQTVQSGNKQIEVFGGDDEVIVGPSASLAAAPGAAVSGIGGSAGAGSMGSVQSLASNEAAQYYVVGRPLGTATVSYNQITPGAGSAGDLWALPWLCSRSGVLASVSMFIGDGTGGCTARMGIYANAAVTHPIPSTLIVDLGTEAGDAVGGAFKSWPSTQAVSAGTLYWFVFQLSDRTIRADNIAITGTGDEVLGYTVSGGSANKGVYRVGAGNAYGAMPATYPGTGVDEIANTSNNYTSIYPLVSLQFTS